jgi:hypothetical protein
MTGRRHRLRQGLIGIAALAALAVPTVSLAQATSRVCHGDEGETPGPACLVAHEEMGPLPTAPIYWHVYSFPSVEAAQHAKPPHAAVVEAFGKVWLFDVGPKTAALAGGERRAEIGPIPMDAAGGPYSALDGASCLETPDGAQVARGEGHSLIVRRGPPMLLMAIGDKTRHGFALILHDGAQPPTTLVHDWTPKGLCPKE